jgi:hypothetical protein
MPTESAANLMVVRRPESTATRVEAILINLAERTVALLQPQFHEMK